jgi:anaerobic dimethyl sulfoxide reductase subunit C (anchor subunit)
MHYLQELPLVLFSLLVQTSVGIVLVGQCILAGAPDEEIRERVRFQSIAALILFGIATLVGLGHTGTPLHGPFTIANVSSSWLSREILMLGVAGFALLCLAYLRFRKPYSSRERSVAALVVIAGLILCYVMSRVYNQRFTPGWQSPAVFPLFLSSLFMLGAVWHGIALSVKRSSISEPPAGALRAVQFWALAGCVIMAACIPLSLPGLNVMVNPWTIQIPYDCLKWSHALHALFSGTAVLLLAAAVFRVANRRTLSVTLTVPAFLLLVAGEIVGRLAFYLSYSRLGM